MPGVNEEPPPGLTLGLLLPPVTHFQQFPRNYRWEFVRRHPFFLQFWKLVRDYRRNTLSSDTDKAFAPTAAIILQRLGISGEPPSPNATLETLAADQLSGVWAEGAAAPATFHSLVCTLNNDLPVETRRRIGQLLLASVKDAHGQPTARDDAIRALLQANDPALDCLPNRPIFRVNLTAPLDTILQSLRQAVDDYKTKEDIPNQRRRDDMLGQYLAVWDLREGWIDGADAGYNTTREMTLPQIAEHLDLPPRTVEGRYRSAFSIISGHRCSLDNWLRIFMVIKLVDVLPLLSTRSVANGTHAVVAQPNSIKPGDGAMADGEAVLDIAKAMRTLVAEVSQLVQKGKDDNDIVAVLGLDPELGTDLIQYLRTRSDVRYQ